MALYEAKILDIFIGSCTSVKQMQLDDTVNLLKLTFWYVAGTRALAENGSWILSLHTARE